MRDIYTKRKTAKSINNLKLCESFGQLVRLGFDITAFTPASYQRPRLERPSKEISSCGRLRA